MAARVARQKRDALSFQSSHNERVRRIAERSLHAQLARVPQPRHAVESAAADNSDADGIRHSWRAASQNCFVFAM